LLYQAQSQKTIFHCFWLRLLLAIALLFSVFSPLNGASFAVKETCCNSAPWGQDADLVHWIVATPGSERCRTPLFGWVAEWGIAFHQKVISPADGPRSHFIPSSSQYTLDAMRKHGFFHGFFLGCDRLMRENNDPWIYRRVSDKSGRVMKFDPTP